ncbi:MAG: DNA-directed RNA polymerase subunit beta' [Anaerolineaceae bacterium 4572_5.2]|nr:MAG: DNA-directed RNA polymerase subunit beta' [Anaerolineaceae bacterium 4572_5.2]
MKSKGLTKLRIGLASPETILSWSYGEVLEPETINYRRLRPEKDGLFCEAIFGPTRDYQCYCGKYKNIRYKGIVCDKCGVEITRSSVRRERMGHIKLAAPVAHLWFSRRIPSMLGRLLDISRRDLDRVLYFAQYMVTYVDEESRQKTLDQLKEDYTSDEGSIGADIISQIAACEIDREEKLAAFEESKKQVEAKYDEKIAAKLEPLIKQGQQLERALQDQVGSITADDIIFPETDEVIVKAKEEISTSHISNVQDVVKGSLKEIEDELKSQKERELEHIKIDIARVRAETSQIIDELQERLEQERKDSQEEYKRLRQELLDLQPLMFLGNTDYRDLRSRWGQIFQAEMGAEAFLDILKRLDLEALSKELWHEIRTTGSKQKRKRATKRLKIVTAFLESGSKPEWMIITVLPVIPPDLRPMVQLDGGRFATSDLNDLYRRVINRNNRLKRLLELGAPDVIVRNEKRMLQEAVDSLIDNSQRGKALSRRGKRELQSLSDMLKGKKGRFRRNLLGKRVDYSGRSVIVSGAKLEMHQCGLPKKMGLELYRPFVISLLVEKGYATNVKGAKRLIERNRPEVWEALDEAILTRPVLLNRAPTLHRLGIQAFEPQLIEGNAIQLHPLVCPAFNADFDGDQMAVHVPLSKEAVKEARELMLSSKNLLKPASGEPIILPAKDMVLGVYYLTNEDDRHYRGEGRVFSTSDEVEMAYTLKQVEIPTKIRLLAKTWYSENRDRLDEMEERLIETTVGQAIFNTSLPPEVQYVNWTLDKGGIKELISEIYEICDEETTAKAADDIKNIGFKYATRSGYSIAISDIKIPPVKEKIVQEALEQVKKVERSFRRGLLTEQEQDERLVSIWQETTSQVAKAVKENMNPHGDMTVMAMSGATKGGFGPIAQLSGMRGLMADPSGRVITVPIISSFREGLTALEYFISSHGARKGLADTALRTADAGYLTRRLVDVSQDIIVNADDCGTEECIVIERSEDIGGQEFKERIFGRVVAEHIIDAETGEIMLEKGSLVSHASARQIEQSTIDSVKVYSPLTCELEHGVCAKCYGLDLGRGRLVEKGTAVGIIAAQSIGEPGTQLTLRTFHTGGVAAASDITTGLPRIEELFEARKSPKGEAVLTEIAGTVHIEASDRYSDMRIVRIDNNEMVSDTYQIPDDWTLNVQEEDQIEEGSTIATHGEEAIIIAENGGKVRFEDGDVIVSYEVSDEKVYQLPSNAHLAVVDGEHVEPAQPLTIGSANTHDLLRIRGRRVCQNYILAEVQKVYRSQGQNIHDKHFEVVVSKTMSWATVTDTGDTEHLPGDLVNRVKLMRENEKLLAEGKRPALFEEVLLGVTKAALETDSFLSAASFQHTIKVLSRAAIEGAEDPLYGLKENVIIGKLIPAGTGFKQGVFTDAEDDEAEPETEPEADTEPEFTAETEPEADTEPEFTAETEPEADTEPEFTAETEPEADTEPEFAAETEIETESVPETEEQTEEDTDEETKTE